MGFDGPRRGVLAIRYDDAKTDVRAISEILKRERFAVQEREQDMPAAPPAGQSHFYEIDQ